MSYWKITEMFRGKGIRDISWPATIYYRENYNITLKKNVDMTVLQREDFVLEWYVWSGAPNRYVILSVQTYEDDIRREHYGYYRRYDRQYVIREKTWIRMMFNRWRRIAKERAEERERREKSVALIQRVVTEWLYNPKDGPMYKKLLETNKPKYS